MLICQGGHLLFQQLVLRRQLVIGRRDNRLRLPIILNGVLAIVGFGLGDFLVCGRPSQRNSRENLLNLRLVLRAVVDLCTELIFDDFYGAPSLVRGLGVFKRDMTVCTSRT